MAKAGIINFIVGGSSKLIKGKTSGLCQELNKASGARQLESELAYSGMCFQSVTQQQSASSVICYKYWVPWKATFLKHWGRKQHPEVTMSSPELDLHLWQLCVPSILEIPRDGRKLNNNKLLSKVWTFMLNFLLMFSLFLSWKSVFSPSSNNQRILRYEMILSSKTTWSIQRSHNSLEGFSYPCKASVHPGAGAES